MIVLRERERSMTEPQRLVWYLPRPTCAKVNNAMQQLTSFTYQTSEQQKDVSQARQTRADSEKLMSFIEWRFPFDANPTVRNIVSSMTSRPEVNIHLAKKIRVAILHKMVGHPALFQEESQSYNY